MLRCRRLRVMGPSPRPTRESAIRTPTPASKTAMPPNRAFLAASRLALATSLLMFGLIVIGSVVRTTGTGLACPDRPLCQGA